MILFCIVRNVIRIQMSKYLESGKYILPSTVRFVQSVRLEHQSRFRSYVKRRVNVIGAALQGDA